MSATTTQTPPADSNGELLSVIDGPIWTRRAPRPLQEQYRAADDPIGWRTWHRHLANRTRPADLAGLFPGRQSPLLWAMPAEPNQSGTAELVERLRSLPRRPKQPEVRAALETEVDNWLWSTAGAAGSALLALECLAWVHELPKLAAYLPAAQWWRLLDRLLNVARDGERTDLLAEPLAHQILAGELPLALGYQFPELHACRSLKLGAPSALARGVAELLDGEGVPQAGYWALFRPLLACWTRARAIGGGKATWDLESEQQFGHLVLEAVRFSRVSGEQVLAENDAGAWSPKLFKLALRLADQPELARLAQRLLPGGKRGKRQPAAAGPPAMHSEWAEVAVLQPAWDCGTKLSIVYGDRRARIELEQRGELLLSGCWGLELRRDGELLEQTSNWEEVCWVSDEDVDYVEIEAKLSGGVKVQRHVLLARQDRCLLLLDSVLGDRPAQLAYRASLPLAAEVGFDQAADTREGWLRGRKSRVACLPLALPEWRVDGRRGDLTCENGRLQLAQSAIGRSMCAPLLLDLDGKRAGRDVTWRQLTVAELRQVLPADVAAGYRAQCGKAQWLVYRSLAAPGTRTVLGQNLSTEFLFGRFHRSGEVDRLLEIE